MQVRLDLDPWEGLGLIFKIGSQRMYLVKDIQKLLQNITAGEIYPLGKKIRWRKRI